MMVKVVYIAGPMRGLDDYGRRNFKEAEDFVKRRTGWNVLNPAILPVDLPQERYMPICLAMLREADGIILLPGWEDSAGATLERRFAEETGKLILELEDIGFRHGEAGRT